VRVRHSKTPLPTTWINHPALGDSIIAEADMKITPRGRLWAKLLVFKDSDGLEHFWDKGLGRSLAGDADISGKRKGRTVGCVSALATEIWSTETDTATTKKFIEVDPRYFCVIGLVETHLKMEVICHEATHAGFAFFNRHKRDYWVKRANNDFNEEDVCYPTGLIAASINRFLYDKGLYKPATTKEQL
jgi:hypothetical protein